jgi:hypothetical protein
MIKEEQYSIVNPDKKLHISDVNNNSKKLHELCPCCFSKADFTDVITSNGEECETDAWFCNFCGGLVCWK